MRKYFYLVGFLVLFYSCKGEKELHTKLPRPILNLIDHYEIPHEQIFGGTKIGGLSGIDYDKENDVFYLISDDRSIHNTARFYKANIHLNKRKIDSVQFLHLVSIKGRNDEKFSNWETSPFFSIDPEDIRYNPIDKYFIWCSEGEKLITNNKIFLQNPSIFVMDTLGKFVSEFTMPQNLKMTLTEKGPRRNGTLEGITFSDDFQSIYTSIEEPLYEDDEKPDVTKGSLVRIFQFDVKTKKNIAQYAYELDPVAHQAIPKEASKTNGISAILQAGKNKLLIVERSYSVGRSSNSIKVFYSDLAYGTDIKKVFSLRDRKFPFRKIPKQMIFNMDDLGIHIDNIEGVSYGKTLPNGNKTLVFVSDNNFSKKQQTQILIFELKYL